MKRPVLVIGNSSKSATEHEELGLRSDSRTFSGLSPKSLSRCSPTIPPIPKVTITGVTLRFCPAIYIIQTQKKDTPTNDVPLGFWTKM